ncbi:hypothetical protein OHT68_06430 [Streptomyces canus]|uniref:hypothetical protein n=1 Tax=Streptomyces canus TaxID=58343 RepID=UPI002E2B8743|nr:hypothetical protein [Streptomyces canus]
MILAVRGVVRSRRIVLGWLMAWSRFVGGCVAVITSATPELLRLVGVRVPPLCPSERHRLR